MPLKCIRDQMVVQKKGSSSLSWESVHKITALPHDTTESHRERVCVWPLSTNLLFGFFLQPQRKRLRLTRQAIAREPSLLRFTSYGGQVGRGWGDSTVMGIQREKVIRSRITKPYIVIHPTIRASLPKLPNSSVSGCKKSTYPKLRAFAPQQSRVRRLVRA